MVKKKAMPSKARDRKQEADAVRDVRRKPPSARIKTLLARPISTWIVASSAGDDGRSPGEQFVSHTIKALQIEKKKKREYKSRFFVVVTERKFKPVEGEDHLVIVLPKPEIKSFVRGESPTFRPDLFGVLTKLYIQQSERQLERIHGIFILCSSKLISIQPILTTLFFDESPAISRLFLHGVVAAVSCSEILSLLDDRMGDTLAACDKIVALTRGESGDTVKDAEQLLQNICEESNRRLAYNMCNTNHADVDIGTIIDMYSYSRIFVTQVFPLEDEFKKLKNRSCAPRYGKYVVHRLQFNCSFEQHMFLHWLHEFLKAHSNEFLRIKGQLAFRGSRKKHILQGICSSFGIEEGGYWSNQSRRCTILIVGKDIKYTLILKQIQQCKARLGWVERGFYWMDSHTIMTFLIALLFVLILCTAAVAAIDFGYFSWESFMGDL